MVPHTHTYAHTHTHTVFRDAGACSVRALGLIVGLWGQRAPNCALRGGQHQCGLLTEPWNTTWSSVRKTNELRPLCWWHRPQSANTGHILIWVMLLHARLHRAEGPSGMDTSLAIIFSVSSKILRLKHRHLMMRDSISSLSQSHQWPSMASPWPATPLQTHSGLQRRDSDLSLNLLKLLPSISL